MTTTAKLKRQADPDVARLRAVKEAARKVKAASIAMDKAGKRMEGAKRVFEALLAAAPPGARDYLRAVVETPVPQEERAGR